MSSFKENHAVPLSPFSEKDQNDDLVIVTSNDRRRSHSFPQPSSQQVEEDRSLAASSHDSYRTPLYLSSPSPDFDDCRSFIKSVKFSDRVTTKSSPLTFYNNDEYEDEQQQVTAATNSPSLHRADSFLFEVGDNNSSFGDLDGEERDEVEASNRKPPLYLPIRSDKSSTSTTTAGKSATPKTPKQRHSYTGRRILFRALSLLLSILTITILCLQKDQIDRLAKHKIRFFFYSIFAQTGFSALASFALAITSVSPLLFFRSLKRRFWWELFIDLFVFAWISAFIVIYLVVSAETSNVMRCAWKDWSSTCVKYHLIFISAAVSWVLTLLQIIINLLIKY